MKSKFTTRLMRREDNSHGESGMTMLELLLAMVIGTIVFIMALKFFVSTSNSFIETKKTSEMQQELRWAMKFLSEHLELAGNGVPPTSGWKVIENYDGSSGAPDSISVLGSYKSLVITTTQNMGNEGSQVKVDNSDEIGIGDLAVISDGTFQEIFMVTNINDLHLWHAAAPPWNDDNKLDHKYLANSSVTIVTYYSFFVDNDEEGRTNLYVKTQAYPPQILLGDIEDFQIRFKLKNNTWVDEADEVYDIRMIEISIIARSPEPLKGYIDPVYGGPYKRILLKSIVIPKNILTTA